MGSHKKRNLEDVLDRYWKGETSIEEEAWLKQNEHAHPIFKYINLNTQETSKLTIEQVMHETQTISAKPRRIQMTALYRWIPSIAASLLIVAAAVFLLKPQQEETPNDKFAMVETYDDPADAYKEVREALLLVSAQMNRTTTQVATQIAKAEPYAEIFK